MAHMSQARKAELAPAIKSVLKQYGMKGTIGVRHNSTLVVNVTEGPLDLISNCNRVLAKRNELDLLDLQRRQYTTHIQVPTAYVDQQFDGRCREFMMALVAAMQAGNYNNSESQVDHFDVGWHCSLNIGQWDKPYCFTGSVTEQEEYA